MAKQTRRFQYQPRDPGTVRNRSNQSGGDYDTMWKEGVKIFKPKEGKNRVRILPPTWANADHYGYNVWVNYRIGVENSHYLSLSSMAREHPELGLDPRDPLAEGRKEAEKEGNKKMADSLKPQKRVAFFLVDRNEEEAGVQLWPAPWTVDKSFCARAIDVETGAVTAVDDPYEGSDIQFHYEKTGKQFPDYPAEKIHVFKPSPLSENETEMQEWLTWAEDHPIPDLLNFYDYDHIAQVFEGHTVKDETGEAPQRTTKAPSASKKPWADDKEDETPAPRRGPVTVKHSAGVTEDEEVDPETGEVTTRQNGNGRPRKEDESAPETRMSIPAIREKLRARQRPSADDE